jgi:hypothetical protein
MNIKDKTLTYNLLAKSQNKISKYAQLTPSGLPQGLGPGKTLLPPDKTWDEIAAEEWPKTVVYKRLEKEGKNPSKAKFVRKNKKIYAILKGVGEIELTTASIKTSHYSDDAPTRSETSDSSSSAIKGLKEDSPAGTGVDERGIAPPTTSTQSPKAEDKTTTKDSTIPDPGSSKSAPRSTESGRSRPFIDLSGNSLFSGNQINTNTTGGNATANASSAAAASAAAAASGSAATPSSTGSSTPSGTSHIDTNSNSQKYHFPGDNPSKGGHYGPFMVNGKKRYFEIEFDPSNSKYKYTGNFVDR